MRTAISHGNAEALRRSHHDVGPGFAGDTITVKHNSGSATVKIYLYGDADVVLDEQNPLQLTLVDTNVMVQDIDASGSGSVTITEDSYIANEASNYTISTNSFTDVDGTNFSHTITTHGNTVLAMFTGVVNITAGDIFSFNIFVDSADYFADEGFAGAFNPSAGALAFPVSFCVPIEGLSAGSHTFKLRWKAAGTSVTATLYAGAGTANLDFHPIFSVFEVS
jgi:hypothetical protein